MESGPYRLVQSVHFIKITCIFEFRNPTIKNEQPTQQLQDAMLSYALSYSESESKTSELETVHL